MTHIGRLSPRSLTKVLLHLVPAGLAVGLLVDLWPDLLRGPLAIVVFLAAPGFLLWRILPGRYLDFGPLAWPAMWLTLSFACLTPPLAVTLTSSLGPALTEGYLVILLVLLGVIAGLRPASRIEMPTGLEWSAIGVAGMAFIYRWLTWHDSSDDSTYLGFMRSLASGGRYPDANPFLSGDIPLAPRWRLDGWTASGGIIAHLGDVAPETVYYDFLPPLLVVAGASALYLLTRVLTGNRAMSAMAALSGLLVPIVTSNSGKTQFKFWYQSIAQNKYAAVVALLPVVVALLIRAADDKRRWRALVAGLALLALTLAHPLVAVMAAGLFLVFLLVRSLIDHRWDREVLVAALIAIAPFLVVAGATSLLSEPYGAKLGNVESISDIAEPTHQVGPIEIWEPIPITVASVGRGQATDALISGHAISAHARVAFLGNGMPFAHWNMLDNMANLLVVLALLVIVIGRKNDPLAVWIVASSIVVLIVFAVPPLATIVARFVTPWQLWRFSWLIPVPLAVAWLVTKSLDAARVWKVMGLFSVAALLVLTFTMAIHKQHLRTGPQPREVRIQDQVDLFEERSGVLIGDAELVVPIAAEHPSISAVSYRGLASMSNAFPTSRSGEAFHRLRDTRRFFDDEATDRRRRNILESYGVDLVILGSEDRGLLDTDALGLRLLEDLGRGYRLYTVIR